MDIESAQPKRICQPLIGILNTRFAWLVVLMMLLFTAASPGRLVYGQVTVSTHEASFEADYADVSTNGTSNSTEETEPNQSIEKTEAQSLRNRLISYVFFGGLMLLFLGLLFGYLRLNHATRGFHSGRLQLAALVLSGLVLLVGYLLWTQVLFK